MTLERKCCKCWVSELIEEKGRNNIQYIHKMHYYRKTSYTGYTVKLIIHSANILDTVKFNLFFSVSHCEIIKDNIIKR